MDSQSRESSTPLASTTEVPPSTPPEQVTPAPSATPAVTAAPSTSAPTSNPTEEMESEPKAPAAPQISQTPTIITITILVQSGVRHNFVLDRAYLERHAVKSSAASKELLTDPMEMTVWQLKECIWKDWRDDWEQRPASALFIKLIQFGAYMQDNSPLKESRLSTQNSNVIHMAIRPAEAGDDEMTQRSTKGAFGQSRDREGTGVSASCRCVIL